MITELILFITCFLIGGLARFWYKGLLRIQKKIGRAAVITLEFFSMLLLAAAFLAVMLFLGDGIFMPFTLIAIVIGFVATSLFI